MALIETAKYPAAIATEADMQNWKNVIPSGASPLLNAAINNSVTSIVLTSGTGTLLPLDNFTVSIDDEVIFVTSRTTDTLNTCVRAYEGSTAASHLINAPVNQRVTAKSHNQLVSEMFAVQTLLGINGSKANVLSPFLPNPVIIRIQPTLAATTDNDIYTCPSGRRAFVSGIMFYNTAGTTTTTTHKVKIGGSYFRIGNTRTTSTLSNTPVNLEFVLLPTDILSINPTASGLNCSILLVEYDATGSSVNSARMTTVTAGENTFYTCPAGKSAILLAGAHNVSASATAVTLSNDSGSSRTVKLSNVNSGGSVSATNLFTPATVITTGNATQFGVIGGLSSGDFISINTDANTAGQFYYANVIEF